MKKYCCQEDTLFPGSQRKKRMLTSVNGFPVGIVKRAVDEPDGKALLHAGNTAQSEKMSTPREPTCPCRKSRFHSRRWRCHPQMRIECKLCQYVTFFSANRTDNAHQHHTLLSLFAFLRRFPFRAVLGDGLLLLAASLSSRRAERVESPANATTNIPNAVLLGAHSRNPISERLQSNYQVLVFTEHMCYKEADGQQTLSSYANVNYQHRQRRSNDFYSTAAAAVDA